MLVSVIAPAILDRRRSNFGGVGCGFADEWKLIFIGEQNESIGLLQRQ